MSSPNEMGHTSKTKQMLVFLKKVVKSS